MDYVVFWSWFSDAYAMRPLNQHPASAPEIKFCGTRDECAAWIARHR